MRSDEIEWYDRSVFGTMNLLSKKSETQNETLPFPAIPACIFMPTYKSRTGPRRHREYHADRFLTPWRFLNSFPEGFG